MVYCGNAKKVFLKEEKMIYDLQRASMLKRISAWILDIILLVIAITGAAWLLSVITGYDSYNAKLDEIYAGYETEYGIVLDISAEEFEALSKEEKARYDEANKALQSNEEALVAYNMMINLTLIIATLSVTLAYLIFDFAVPLFFGNGQTIGKKIFGIALMRTDGVRIKPFMLFVRTLLGKCTVETLVPMFIVLMIIFGSLGLTGTFILFAFALIQLITVAATRTNSALHDIMAATVAVDFSSQMIFESEAELLAYKNKIHAENAARDKYIP